MEPQQGMSVSDVMALLQKMDESNQKNLIAAIQELKKPSPEELAKKEASDAKIKQQQEMRFKLAKAEEDRKLMQKRSCRHSSYNPATGIGKHAFRAQVHTPDGVKPYFEPMCIQCQWIGPKIAATPDMLTQGVNLDQYPDLTIERIEEWAKTSPAGV
jgi:hypothetical protein